MTKWKVYVENRGKARKILDVSSIQQLLQIVQEHTYDAQNIVIADVRTIPSGDTIAAIQEMNALFDQAIDEELSLASS